MWLHVNNAGPFKTINADKVLLIEGAYSGVMASTVVVRMGRPGKAGGPTLKTGDWQACVDFIARLSMYFGPEWVLTDPWGPKSSMLLNTKFLETIYVDPVSSGVAGQPYAAWGKTKKDRIVLKTGTLKECDEWVRQFIYARGLFI